PDPVPEAGAITGGARTPALQWRQRRSRRLRGRLREPVAVQPRVRAPLRPATPARRRSDARRGRRYAEHPMTDRARTSSRRTSGVLFAVYEKRRLKRRPSLVYCGDDRTAKQTAARLIRDLGFDPVDLGALEMARYTEPMTMLVAKIAYEGDGGPALAYRFEQFE